MSILDALKNLVVKCGGTPKGSNIAEVINDLAETSSGDKVLIDKTITENGEYDPADDNADGYKSVTVNVPQSGGGGVPGVTVLHGTGTTPVELPNGFEFPDVDDCSPSSPSDPMVGVYLVYLDADGYNTMEETTVHSRIAKLALDTTDSLIYTQKTTNSIKFSNLSGYDATFTLQNGGILFQGAASDFVSYTPSEQTDFLIVVVDMRP